MSDTERPQGHFVQTSRKNNRSSAQAALREGEEIVGEKVVGGRLVKVAAKKKKPPAAPSPTAASDARRLSEDRQKRNIQRNADKEAQEERELLRAQVAWDLAIKTGRFHPDDVDNEIIRRKIEADPKSYPRPTKENFRDLYG